MERKPKIRSQSRGRIPTYRLHKPSGQAVVTISGRDHYLGNYGAVTSRAEYDRLIAERQANKSTGHPCAHP
jgi:hypothetical protein